MSALSDTGSRSGSNRLWLRIILMAIVPLILIGVAVYFYFTAGRYASTDDAYVKADRVQISSDVSGRVIAVEVKDNQQVTAGQVLVRLDDGSFRISLEKAKAQLAATQLQIDGLRATYKQRQADLKASEDNLAYMQREADRQAQLLASHVTSQQKYDEARHGLDAARQQLSGVQQQAANVLASLGGDPNLPTEKHPLVLQAQAQIDQAVRDLNNTVIHAPASGYVTMVDKLPVGQYMTIGVPAFELISTERAWIEANFKETDLTRMRPGQTATVDIDSYPDRNFTAKVQSISAGTGSEFSVLPPQNATGNWVKVVQRVPVRLVIENADADHPLRAGMSATVEVDTRNVPSWAAATATDPAPTTAQR
jgi:membrane fusion protein (multidrug efflux system)